MIPLDRPALRRHAMLAIALLLGLGLAGPAAASPETFKRGLGNVLFGPVDIALAPVVASQAVYNNLRDVDDTLAVQVFYTPPGVVWNTFIQIGGGLLRIFAGALEIVPGLFLIPFGKSVNVLGNPSSLTPRRSEMARRMSSETLTFRLSLTDFM